MGDEAKEDAKDEAKDETKEAADNTTAASDTNTSTKSVPHGKLVNVTKEKTVEVWEETLQKVLHMEKLNFTRTHKGVQPMSDDDYKIAVTRHRDLVKEEKERT